jgi:metal-dependent HD superfamily phosphatase/phosphodiesterase
MIRLIGISDTLYLVKILFFENLVLVEIADKPLSKKMQGRIPYWHRSYEITKISQRAIAQVELYPFKRSKEV